MKIVIDTNRIIASLIKDSYSRRVIFDSRFEFITPSYTLSEISKYTEEIIKKAKISQESFKLLMYLLFERIIIIPEQEYSNFMKRAKELIKDKSDSPFLALALSYKADAIWSDDAHFKEQKVIKVLTTKEIISLI